MNFWEENQKTRIFHYFLLYLFKCQLDFMFLFLEINRIYEEKVLRLDATTMNFIQSTQILGLCNYSLLSASLICVNIMC